MKVLSLFDGISCGRLALERAGIKVDKYYASEIEKKAIEITMKNYPDTVQLGDITKITNEILDELEIDIVIGGSPCQDFSVYKLDRGEANGFDGEKSSLFYHFERILKYVKPKYFLLENVPMAKKEWEDTISEIMRVKPLKINSSVISAAERKRLYWTNIEVDNELENTGVMIKDIIQNSEDVDSKYWYDKPFVYNGDDKKVQCTIDISGHRNMKEVYNVKGKCNTLLADGAGGHRVKKLYQDGRCRKFTPIEYERMQTLPDNYTSGVADSHRYSAIGNGWTVDVIAHIFKGLK